MKEKKLKRLDSLRMSKLIFDWEIMISQTILIML